MRESFRARVPLGPGMRRVRLAEFRRDSLWLGPAVAALAAWALADILSKHSPSFVSDDHLFSTNIDDARSLLGTIAASILTFTGVVFSITLVALQTASSQYSPRVLRSFVRRPITKIALSSFIATFVYSLVVLSRLGTLHHGGESVPAAAVGFAFVMVLISVFVFVVFVHATVRSMRVTYVIEAVAKETIHSLTGIASDARAESRLIDTPLTGSPQAATFPHRGAVLDGLDVSGLVRLATSRDATIVLRVEVGTFVARGTHIADVYAQGTEASIPAPSAAEIVRRLDLAAVRTLYQDPRYGVRQLVDIAIRALSPAINDPTTAVQVLDRLNEIVRLAAEHPDPSGRHTDADGGLRLVHPISGWTRLTDLAFTEIIRYGFDSPQISRKLVSIFRDLEQMLDGERRELIEFHCGVLERAVNRHSEDPATFERALLPDALGLG